MKYKTYFDVSIFYWKKYKGITVSRVMPSDYTFLSIYNIGVLKLFENEITNAVIYRRDHGEISYIFNSELYLFKEQFKVIA